MPSTTDRSTRLGRRALIQGAAWSVPVVMIAAPAPAFAASPCTRTSLSWDSRADGSKFTSATVGGVLVTLVLSGATSAADNAEVTSTTTGGMSKVLRFYDLSTDNTTQTIKFTFSKVVRGLSFTLLDIDQSSWDDRVVINSAGYTYARGSAVQGTGSSGSPFQAAQGQDNGVAGTSPNGNVTLTWAGDLTEVSFAYKQGNVTGNQTGPFIGISDLAFTPIAC
jgi:hypothetical protein